MAIGTVAGFVNSPGSSQTATPTATLPTITTAGKAYTLVGTNAGSTTTVTTPPSGWTLEAGPVDNASNNMRVWLYSKDVTSADSGATFTMTLSLTGRWAVGGAVLPGASGIDVSAQWIDNTDDLSIDIPAITPGVDNAYRMALVYTRSVSGALTVTPPGGWNEHGDVCSTNGSGARFGAWVGGVQLTGQAGVAQSIASATYSTNARNSGWQLTIAPATTSTTYQAAGTAAAASTVTAAVTAVLLAAGTVVGVSGVSGDATRVPLVLAAAGTVAGSSAVAGDATRVPLTLAAAGTIAATTTTAGDATRLGQAFTSSGTVTATTTTVGDATRVPRTFTAAGTIAATSTASGSPSVLGGPVTYPAAGSVVAVTTATGAVTARLVAAGTSSATSATTGSLTARLTVAGTTAGTSGSSGDATLIAAPVTYQAAGVVSAVSAITGDTAVIGETTVGSMTGGDAPRAHASGSAAPSAETIGADAPTATIQHTQTTAANMSG